MNGIEIQGDLFEPNEEKKDCNLKSDTILYIDNSKDNDLIEFIIKAQEQGCNCLDLSKRNIKEFPSQLLEYTSLQYLYLEGNKLTQLPTDLFLRLPHLKWLDLRDNQLTSIPSSHLAKHQSLQYLLLSGNHLRTLPYELGKVKTLSALNLDGNPLDYPPFQIIKQGIKSIQQYLRNKLTSDHQFSSSEDDDDEQQQTRRVPSPHPAIYPRKSKSEVGYYETTQSNLLPPHLQSCIQYKRISCSAIRPPSTIRSRPGSEMKFSQIKTKMFMKNNNNNNSERNVYTNHEQPLMHLKHRDITIDEQIQQLYQKSFITSNDFEEPIIRTPFHIDPHYMQMMNKNQQKLNRYNTRQNHLFDEDEERRQQDRHIQDRIRQITDKMLKRRLEARSNGYEERRQVKLELRELRKLEIDAGKKLQNPSKNFE